MNAATSSIAFSTLGVRLVAAGHDAWTLEISARLLGDEPSTELFILARETPLRLEAIRAERPFSATMLTEGDSATARISKPQSDNTVWRDAEFVLRCRWSRSTANAMSSHRFHAPCLVLPNMLPHLVSATGAVSFRAPSRLPRVFFDEELPPRLNAGGVAVADDRGRTASELLQTVIFPLRDSAPDLNDLVITDSKTPQEPADLHQVYAYVIRLREFLSEQFGPELPVRPVVCLTDEPTDYPSAGAYCPLSYENVGARKKNSGKPAHVIRILAQSWLAGGMRLWGENAADLALALGGAYGLHWLEREGYHDYLRQLVAISERSVADAKLRRIWKPGDAVRAMELSFFRGLSNATLRTAVRDFVRARWGTYVEQDALITLLRAYGISVPTVFA